MIENGTKLEFWQIVRMSNDSCIIQGLWHHYRKAGTCLLIQKTKDASSKGRKRKTAQNLNRFLVTSS